MPARNPRVNVVLEKPLYEAVDHLAMEEGVSRSTMVRELVKEAIESRLMTAPQEFGLPLRKNLGGFWKLRVEDYRVVFKVEGEMVYILAIRYPKSVYEDMTGRIE